MGGRTSPSAMFVDTTYTDYDCNDFYLDLLPARECPDALLSLREYLVMIHVILQVTFSCPRRLKSDKHRHHYPVRT
jgi:hypothetical protein